MFLFLAGHKTAHSYVSTVFDVGRIIVTRALKLTFETSTNGAHRIHMKTIDSGVPDVFNSLSYSAIHLSTLLTSSILPLEAGTPSLLLVSDTLKLAAFYRPFCQTTWQNDWSHDPNVRK